MAWYETDTLFSINQAYFQVYSAVNDFPWSLSNMDPFYQTWINFNPGVDK